MKAWLVRAMVGLVMVGALVGASAGPAAATVCSYPGCGGSVYNTPSSGGYTAVANCWSTGGLTYEGTSPPCATNYGSGSYNSWMYLESGQDTYNIYHFYDVDAFMVEGGCYTHGYGNRIGSFAYDRRGKGRLWIRSTASSAST
jgi:hypothetical protein